MDTDFDRIRIRVDSLSSHALLRFYFPFYNGLNNPSKLFPIQRRRTISGLIALRSIVERSMISRVWVFTISLSRAAINNPAIDDSAMSDLIIDRMSMNDPAIEDTARLIIG